MVTGLPMAEAGLIPAKLPVGQHLLADLYGVSAQRLNDCTLLTRCLTMAADCAGLKALAAPVLHAFDGGGVTGFLLLAESHIAFHTYPELGYIAVDIFSCGAVAPAVAIDIFVEALQPLEKNYRVLSRGSELAVLKP
jgi:S-adenosylmethionine decarboxylase